MSALETYPRELSLSQRRNGKWRLLIHTPGVSGWAETSSQAGAEAIAEALAPALRDLAARESAEAGAS